MACGIGAIVLIVPMIDTSLYRPILEQKLKALTGRDLRIVGELRLRVTTQLSIIGDDVRVIDAARDESADWLRIDRVDARIELLPLLRRTVHVERLQLQGLRLLLNGGTERQQRDESSASPAGQGQLWKFDVGSSVLILSDARFVIKDNAASHHELRLKRLTAKRSGTDTLAIDAEGDVDQHPASFRVSAKTPNGIITQHAPIELTLAVTFDAMTVAARGAIDDINDIDLTLSIKGDDLAAVAQRFRQRLPSLGRFELTGRLRGSRRQLALQDVRFDAGHKDAVSVSARGNIADLQRLRDYAFDIDVNVTDAAPLRPWLGTSSDWLPAAQFSGQLTRRRGEMILRPMRLHIGHTALSGEARIDIDRALPRVVATMHAPLIDLSQLPAAKVSSLKATLLQRLDSPAPLRVDWLRRLNLDATLSADSVRLPKDKSLARSSVRSILHQGKLTLAPITVRLSPRAAAIAGRVTLQPAANDANGVVRARVSLASGAIPLAELLALVSSPIAIEQAPTQIDIELNATGATPRALLRTLAGEVKIVIGRGRFPNGKVDFGANLLNRLLAITQPAERRRAELICATSSLPIRAGVITSDRNLALHTSNVTIVASGTVDLPDDFLQMYLYTRATEGIGLEAGKLTNMFMIEGAIEQPAVRLNPSGVVKGGLSIGAAVATGGVSLLFEGLATKVAGDANPCATALRVRPPPMR